MSGTVTPTAPPGAPPAAATGTALATTQPAHPNVFAPIVELMRSIPDSLEAPNAPGGAPRYVRIARLRPFLKPAKPADEKVAGVMADGVGYFIQGMGYILKYGLKLQDLLIQGDAGQALFETASALVKTVTQEEFLKTIVELNTTMLDNSSLSLDGLKNTMAPVASGIDTVNKYVGFIPEPRDLDMIGQQLYRMLVIEMVAAPGTDADLGKETMAIDMVKTGKLRLIHWALNRPFKPIDSGATTDMQITTLGQRRLRKTAATNLPKAAMGTWKDADGNVETVFQYAFANATATTDISELQALLKGFGYPLTGAVDGSFDDATEKGLAQFQSINGLPVNGQLDVATLNQLLHLHYDPDPKKGRMRMAKRYDEQALTLANFVWPKV
ncbi:MAG: peptidoglycan-binding domain-containing protein [Paracraurococcus sp.]